MLKNKFTYLGAILLSVLRVQAQTPMSLEQCVTYALENHKQVQVQAIGLATLELRD